MGLGKKKKKKGKRKRDLASGYHKSRGPYYLLAVSPHLQAEEDLQEKASVGVYPAEYLLAVLRPSANKQEDFVQFKKVTILLLLLLLAFS